MFLAHCLVKKPEDRPGTVQAVMEPFLTKKVRGPEVLQPRCALYLSFFVPRLVL